MSSGSAAITVASDSAGTATVVGFATGAGTAGTAGTAAAVTVDGQAAAISAGSQGLNNQVTYGGADGITFSLGVTGGQTAASGNTTISVSDQSLNFQIGANANETAKISIDKMTADSLGSGVSGLNDANTKNLSLIDVTTASGARTPSRLSTRRSVKCPRCEASWARFQANTLESNSNNSRRRWKTPRPPNR